MAEVLTGDALTCGPTELGAEFPRHFFKPGAAECDCRALRRPPTDVAELCLFQPRLPLEEWLAEEDAGTLMEAADALRALVGMREELLALRAMLPPDVLAQLDELRRG